MYRQTNFQTTSNIITFDITKEEEAHKDITFELTIGQHPMAVRIFFLERNDDTTISANDNTESEQQHNSNQNNNGRSETVTKALAQFAALNRGFTITAKHIIKHSNTSGVMFYANDSPEQRICDYRHQIRVRSKSDTTTSKGPGETYATDPLLQLAAANGKLYMALHSVEPISSNISLVCYLDPPRTTVSDSEDDFYSIWRVATHYVVSPPNQAAVVQRLRVKQHLMDDYNALRDPTKGGITPLHVIATNAADPAFAKLLLSTGWKAFDPDLLDEKEKGETPLIKLLQRPAVHDPNGPWHFRAVALLEVFIKFAGASLSIQSRATGDTATHLAVRYHAYGGKILPFLLNAGGGHATILAMRNNQGVTPEEELVHTNTTTTNSAAAQKSSGGLSSLQDFLRSGKDEALKLLKNCDREMVQERAINRFKVRGLPLYRGTFYGDDRERTTTSSSHDEDDDDNETDDFLSSNNNNHHHNNTESLKSPAPDLVVWNTELGGRRYYNSAATTTSHHVVSSYKKKSNGAPSCSSSEKVTTSPLHQQLPHQQESSSLLVSSSPPTHQQQQQHYSTITNNYRKRDTNYGLTSSSNAEEDPILSCAASRTYKHQIGSANQMIDDSGVRRPVVRAKLAKVIFDKYDTDHDGFISRNALLHAIHSYDAMGLPQQAIDAVVESIGICQDGKVNIDEFALILIKLQSRG